MITTIRTFTFESSVIRLKFFFSLVLPLSHEKKYLDTWVVFIEFPDGRGRGRLLRGHIFQNVFEDHQAGDGIKEISTFLDNTILIAIATAEHFRD